MSKTLKIILWSLLGVFITTLVICYLTIPETTKHTVDIVIEYINKPLPIIGVSTLAVGLIIYKIISITGIGKKSLKELENEIKAFETSIDEKREEAKEYYEKASKSYQEQKAILSEYSKGIKELYQELINICQTIPNAKIKAYAKVVEDKLNEFNTNCLRKLEEIEEKINGKEESEETING